MTNFLTILENLISFIISKSNFNVIAVISWTIKVFSRNCDFLIFWILCYTICWAHRSYFWPVVKLYFLSCFLPLLSVRWQFDFGITIKVSFWCITNLFLIIQFLHYHFISNQLSFFSILNKSTFNWNILHCSIIEFKLIKMNRSYQNWRISCIWDHIRF